MRMDIVRDYGILEVEYRNILGIVSRAKFELKGSFKWDKVVKSDDVLSVNFKGVEVYRNVEVNNQKIIFQANSFNQFVEKLGLTVKNKRSKIYISGIEGLSHINNTNFIGATMTYEQRFMNDFYKTDNFLRENLPIEEYWKYRRYLSREKD